VGLHVDTSVLCAKSHHCGISSFSPKFPVVGGFDDRYHLFFVCGSSYVEQIPFFGEGIFCWNCWVPRGADARKIPPKSHLTHHKMSNRCTALPPAALLSLSMATSAMDPNRGAAPPHEPSRGARRPGSRALRSMPLFGAPKWRPSKN